MIVLYYKQRQKDQRLFLTLKARCN